MEIDVMKACAAEGLFGEITFYCIREHGHEGPHRYMIDASPIEKFFLDARHNRDLHLGLGDIRMTLGMQDEVLELVRKLMRCV